MSRNPLSKHSVASRTSRAAGREDQEARLQLAADKLDNGQHGSLRKAAAAHDLPEATLRHRRKGRHTTKDGHVDQQALLPEAETALVERIWRSACCGLPLTPALIRKHTNTVCHPVPGYSEPVDIGERWMQGFLLRHLSICSDWSRCLDNAHLTGATEQTVRGWFDRLGKIMCEFNVVSTNVFNMDKTGFMFGQGASKRMVIPSGDPASWFRAQPGT